MVSLVSRVGRDEGRLVVGPLVGGNHEGLFEESPASTAEELFITNIQ